MATEHARPRAEVVVDLGAIRHNVARLRDLVETPMMTVVKADAYGHGMPQVARAARAAGADWLGVATLAEAVELREAGDRGRLLCWLAVPGEDYRPVLERDVDVTAYGAHQVGEIDAAARAVGTVARLHLKFDTGLSRGGAPRGGWQPLLDAALAAEHVQVVGLWSHLACADQPDHPANDRQHEQFCEAVSLAERAGVRPEVRHLANSAAALLRPDSRFDLVRVGIATYGLSPAPAVVSAADLGLVPAMTVRGALAMGKDLPAGAGISYGHRYLTPEPMHVGLVPLGYADGVPRIASARAEVLVRGRRAPVLGTICMDQFVVAAPEAEAGDEFVLFGPGGAGEPTADEWARWCETITYEIVTGMRGRHTRRWVGDGVAEGTR